jgi:hypothetical protein
MDTAKKRMVATTNAKSCMMFLQAATLAATLPFVYWIRDAINPD